MQEKRKGADYIIKKIHVKCKTYKCDNKTWDKQPQNICWHGDTYQFQTRLLCNNKNNRTDKHSKDMEGLTEHIIILILENALLNTEIDIKVNILVKVHLNKLEELKHNKIKRGMTFTCIETDLRVPLHLKCKVCG